MYVCICKAITEKDLLENLQGGKRSLDEVQNACGAGTDCGSCRPKIEKYLRDSSSTPTGEGQMSETREG